jgi:hypothetical protein
MVKSPGTGSIKSPPVPAANRSALGEYDALGLAQLIQRKEISPLELLEATITRAESAHAQFNFLSQKHYDYARAAPQHLNEHFWRQRCAVPANCALH